MTDEQKNRWIGAGLGVKPDAEVGVAMGGVTRQRVQQIRKMLGTPHGKGDRILANHQRIRDSILQRKAPGLKRFCKDTGIANTTVYDIEREFGVTLPLLPHGRPIRFTRQRIVDAIHATDSIVGAGRLLELPQSVVERYIKRYKIRGLVNIIMLARGQRPRIETQRP